MQRTKLLLLAVVCALIFPEDTGRQPSSLSDKEKAIEKAFLSHRNRHYANIPDAYLEKVLMDFQNRIPQEFKVPSGIEAAVRFWLKVYTQYSTAQLVIFDEMHMDMIYEVVDLRTIQETARNAVVSEILSKSRIKHVKKQYEQAFRSLVKHPHPKKPTPIEANILRTIESKGLKKGFQERAKHLRYMIGQRDNVVSGLMESGPYFEQMEEIFERFKLPKDLIKLCLVESSFNVHAWSRVGAAGVWQFMPASAKAYLRIDESLQIDERLSPLKSTVAAARHLKSNFDLLGAWPLAIIAYNHGPKGLPRLRKKKQVTFETIAPLFSVKNKTLGWASRNYYSEFLAMVLAERYKNELFGEMPLIPAGKATYMQVKEPQKALEFALEHGTSYHQFKLLNADVRNLNQILPKGFWIALPSRNSDLEPLILHYGKGKPKKLQS